MFLIFRILVTSPPNVSSNTFVTVLHVLVIMASHGSDVGPMLLEENIGATLRQLLVGTGTGALKFGTTWNAFGTLWETFRSLVGSLSLGQSIYLGRGRSFRRPQPFTQQHR